MKGIKLVDVDLSEARTETIGTCGRCILRSASSQ